MTEFIRDLAKTQIGEEEYLGWVPFLGTLFLFIAFLFFCRRRPFPWNKEKHTHKRKEKKATDKKKGSTDEKYC